MQLSPYDTVRLMRVPVVQADALEQALLSALPVGPQTAAGGIILPELFKGELNVTLREGRNLPVWGFPGQSNPFCQLVCGQQAEVSRKEDDTGQPGKHRFPVWNQEFEFLVEDPNTQKVEISVKDSHITGRVDVGRIIIPISRLLPQGSFSGWMPLLPPPFRETEEGGEIWVGLTYKPYEEEDKEDSGYWGAELYPYEEEDEEDSGYREAELYARTMATKEFTDQPGGNEPITDVRSAAAASSRAAVAASAAINAVAMTQAAAARAAARATRAAQNAAASAAAAASALPMFKGDQKQPEAVASRSASETEDKRKGSNGSNGSNGNKGSNGSNGSKGSTPVPSPPHSSQSSLTPSPSAPPPGSPELPSSQSPPPELLSETELEHARRAVALFNSSVSEDDTVLPSECFETNDNSVSADVNSDSSSNSSDELEPLKVFVRSSGIPGDFFKL
eukprot:gene2501-5458_t